MEENPPKRVKTLWTKEKLLDMNNFSFTDSVFKRLVLQTFENKDLFGKELHVWRTSVLKTQWEKEKLIVTSNFSFSHSVFYLFWKLSAIYIKL